MLPSLIRPLVLLLLLMMGSAVPAQAATVAQEVQTSWRLLDYIGVDYREAVASGKVINPLEYQEMTEFSATVSAKLRDLPQTPHKARLVQQAGELETAARQHDIVLVVLDQQNLSQTHTSHFSIPSRRRLGRR